ncbi:MAG: hypothetical protein M3357_04535 [Actinomycetota bacterium]|nr:hypothetical protein [Actinomycetota bacterium]
MFLRLMAAAGCVLAGVALPVLEAEAQRAPSPLADTCEEAARGEPTGPARKSTVPPDGSTVQPGEAVEVAITWPPETFAGDAVHKVLDCVTVGGALSPELSAEERNADNDGVFQHRFVVPADAGPGTIVCDRGFVSGPGATGIFARHKTNEVCMTVAPSPEATPAHPPAAPVMSSPRVDDQVEVPPDTRTLDGVVIAPPVLPQRGAAPGPRPAPVRLPFTGPGGVALPLAGAALALGGLALVAGQPTAGGVPSGPPDDASRL